jgi:hypothetical protein
MTAAKLIRKLPKNLSERQSVTWRRLQEDSGFALIATPYGDVMMQPDTKKQRSKVKQFFLWFFLTIGILFVAMLVMISMSSPFNPVSSFFNTMGFVVTGRLHFPTQRIGEVVTDEAGNHFTIFRQVIVDPTKEQPDGPGAILVLHFKVTNMSTTLNEFYSLVPLPLYIGNPGFRSKLFTINGDDCQSIYEWDTVQDAEQYAKSVALKTILMRSVPGSVSEKIISTQK